MMLLFKKIFLIKKGNHSSSFIFPRLTFKSSISARIRLIGDFSYISDNIENQLDANKIMGLSDSYHHHIDSIRVGYRFINNKIELLSYYYNNGVRHSSSMGYVYQEEEFNIKIEIVKDKYYITFKKIRFEYPRTSRWSFIRYVLYPYFGGQEKSKKDIRFNITYI